MGMTNHIKALCAIREVDQMELAKRLGISQPALSKKYKLDNWRENDLRQIAEVLDASFKGIFVLNENGKEI